MNPYNGPDGDDIGPDEDFDADFVTMNPPRWHRWRHGRPVAIAGVAVVALAGGAGVGYTATHSLSTNKAADTSAVAAGAATPSPSASPVGPGKGPGAGRGWHAYGGVAPNGPMRFARGPAGAGLVHGEFTVPKSGGGYQTVDAQNGTVTAVSSSSITVKSSDGYTASYAVSSKTVVDAQAAGIGSVKKGDTVFVLATVSGSTATASNVFDVTAVKAGRASFGFREGPAKPPVPAQPPTA